MKYCYGVDLGGTAIKFGFFDETEQLLEKWQEPTDTSENGSHIIADIARVVLAHMEKKQLSKEDVIGICAGVPGAVNEENIVMVAPNIGWHEVDFCGKLAELTGISCHVLNDANAAALGEYSQGGGKGTKSMVLMTLGTGIGGGIILNGQLLVGFRGAAGEVGHMRINDQESTPCSCGRYGCLEQYSSATGLVRSYRQFREAGEKGALPLEKSINAKDVFDAFYANEEAAVHAVERLCYYLGKACAVICTVVSPEIIVLGGGVSHAGEPLLNRVKEQFDKMVYAACKDTKIVLATAGNDAGIFGCAHYLIKG